MPVSLPDQVKPPHVTELGLPAELRLGEIYLHGNLVLPDFAQAKTYLESSAYQGNPRAAMLLGQMYRVGIGMTANPTETYA
jgi:TPR repeat protein